MKPLRHVTDASQLAAKSQRSKATLSSVAELLQTKQASVLLLPTLIAFGQEVWYNITSIFYLNYPARVRSAGSQRACALRALGLLLADGAQWGGGRLFGASAVFFTKTAVPSS